MFTLLNLQRMAYAAQTLDSGVRIFSQGQEMWSRHGEKGAERDFREAERLRVQYRDHVEDADIAKDRGKAFFEAGEFVAAAEFYQTAIDEIEASIQAGSKSRSSCTDALADYSLNMGKAYLYAGMYGRSIDSLQHGLTYRSHGSDIHFFLGRDYLELHNYRKALEHFRLSLGVHRKDDVLAYYHFVFGKQCAEADVEDAIRHFANTIKHLDEFIALDLKLELINIIPLFSLKAEALLAQARLIGAGERESRKLIIQGIYTYSFLLTLLPKTQEYSVEREKVFLGRALAYELLAGNALDNLDEVVVAVRSPLLAGDKPLRKMLPHVRRVNFFSGNAVEKGASRLYQAGQGEQAERFDRKDVPHNGDCGYIAFGITREEARTTLRSHATGAGEMPAAVREILRHIIEETLITEDFISYLLRDDSLLQPGLKQQVGHDYREHLRLANPPASQAARDAAVRQLKLHATTEAIVMAYIDYDLLAKRIDFGWAHLDVLRALARINNIDLRVWELNGERTLIPCPHYAHQENPAAQRKDLLYVGDSHFEKLQLVEPQAPDLNPRQFPERAEPDDLAEDSEGEEVETQMPTSTPETKSRLFYTRREIREKTVQDARAALMLNPYSAEPLSILERLGQRTPAENGQAQTSLYQKALRIGYAAAGDMRRSAQFFEEAVESDQRYLQQPPIQGPAIVIPEEVANAAGVILMAMAKFYEQEERRYNKRMGNPVTESEWNFCDDYLSILGRYLKYPVRYPLYEMSEQDKIRIHGICDIARCGANLIFNNVQFAEAKRKLMSELEVAPRPVVAAGLRR